MARIIAIDVLRGITIASMIMVNNQGSNTAFHLLKHSAWNGLTVSDLVFPFFLFIMGMSTYLSLRKYEFRFTRAAGLKIVRRMLLLFAIGLLLNFLSDIDSPLRYMGVMQRLSLCYGLASLIVLTVPHKVVPFIAVALLVIHGALLLGCNGYFNGPGSIVYDVDAALLGPAHMYHHGEVVDPEGFVSTIGALAQVLAGFSVMAHVVRHLSRLIATGIALLSAGLLLAPLLPVNKRVWSPSFVLVTCGLACLLLVALIYIIDRRGHTSWATFFHAFGINPLFMYIVSELIAIGGGAVGAVSLIHDKWIGALLSPCWTSAIYSILFVVLCWLIGLPLWKHKIYVKI